MVQVFVFCERNFKGAIVEIKKTATIDEFKLAIRAQQEAMAPEFEGKSLLLGGRIEMFEGKARQTVDLGKTCDPCGRGFSKTNQVRASRHVADRGPPA